MTVYMKYFSEFPIYNRKYFLILSSRDNFVKVNIFFETLNYEEIEEKPLMDVSRYSLLSSALFDSVYSRKYC